MEIINQIEIYLKKYKLLNKETHFLIGFSGGADSMLLLYFLKQLQNFYNYSISALHVNHNWRGLESDLEEKNCIEFCKKYSINCYCEKLNDKIKHDENSARNARYEIFDKYAKKIGANAILTAHNSTDVVETFVYRLVKGMSVQGALSIPEVRKAKFCNIYRPLLSVSSKEIRQKCKELNLNFNVDSSNNDNKYKRNLIRNEILPQFGKINKNFEKSVLSFIENLKSHKDLIENYCLENYNSVIKNNKLQTIDFVGLSQELQRNIIYEYLQKNNIEPDKKLILKMIEQIIKNLDKPNGKKYSVKNATNSKEDISWFCSKSQCYLIKKNTTFDEKIIFEKDFSSPIKSMKYDNQKVPKSSSTTAIVNKNSLKFPLELRKRKNGDVIQPFSHKSEIKLKDYFINQKIPEHKRDEIPLLCCKNEVLWAIGVGLNEKLRADLNCKEQCIIIKYEKG